MRGWRFGSAVAMALCPLAAAVVVLAGMLNGSAAAPGDSNLLQNGSFTAEAGGLPAEWTIRDSGQRVSLDKQEEPAGAEQSLRVDVVKDAGEGYGEILQAVKIKPATLYRLQGDLRMTQARLGLYQTKLYTAGKEISRVSTDEAVLGRWQTLTKEFRSDEADSAQVLCRWRQNRSTVGQTVWFANVKLTEMGPAPVQKKEPVPPPAPKCEAVPTFESVGLYWSLPQGSPKVAAQVAYRAAGETAWKAAQDLWYDGRALGGRPAEYRGSRTRHGYFGDGRVYVLNNTVLILPGREPQVRGGVGDGDRTLCNYITRNNILQVRPRRATGRRRICLSASPTRTSPIPTASITTYTTGSLGRWPDRRATGSWACPPTPPTWGLTSRL